MADADADDDDDGGVYARVEVNQRALIDKILARYASAGAVYRELLQNSNDAEATIAEIVIVTTAAASSPSSSSSSSSRGKDVDDANKPPSSSSSSTSSSSLLSKSSSLSLSMSVASSGVGAPAPLVTRVTYRNDGHPFRPQDWSRLRKIAEGNPDETKVGAFGVGAYTMFSVCEEPVVISGPRGGGEECMKFFWRGDSLWTKTSKAPPLGIVADVDGGHALGEGRSWTSFVMPSRDPYPVPDMVEFGRFLAASLTFTQCLGAVRVYVDRALVLDVRKTILESHPIVPPRASSWWKNDGAVTSSSTGMFALGRGPELTQTSVRLTASLRGPAGRGMETSAVLARYASAQVRTAIPPNVEGRMVRVTKKRPPRELTVQVLLDAVNDDDNGGGGGKKKDATSSSRLTWKSSEKRSGAALVADSFAPVPGSGRVFIGFRTSQTTGLGIHVSAPLLPTVEREAIDFVDPALREYNCELLETCGMLMRLVLENAMGRIGTAWEGGREEREKWEGGREERRLAREGGGRGGGGAASEGGESANDEGPEAAGNQKSATISSSLFGFASYMARGVRHTVTEAMIKPVQEILGEDDETTELLSPNDDRPLSREERDAIILMKSFSPCPSTPDSLVGACLARGMGRCLPSSSPPVLTTGGVMRGSEAKLPNHGMEAFGFNNVVRAIMLENAKEYHTVIANVPRLNVDDLICSLKNTVLDETKCVRLLKWWPKVCRVERSMERCGLRLKEAIKYELEKDDDAPSCTIEVDGVQFARVRRLDSILYFTPKYLLELPLPETSFPPSLQKEIGLRTLENDVFRDWFTSLNFDIWTSFISQHPCLVKGLPEEMNILALATLGKHFDSLDGQVSKRRFIELLPVNEVVIPFDCGDENSASSENQTAIPKELYLPSADLSAFSGLGSFHKVSKRLPKAGVSEAFLLAMGVRNAISIEFLFLHLDTLQWNTNPRPLIKYLLDADLSPADLHKLRSTQYLPAENDQSRVYAPSELFFKDPELAIFPFVRFLQWPASEGMSKAHRDFLIKLGVKVDPPLQSVMNFMEKECTKDGGVRDERAYEAALTFLTQRLGPNGIYERAYSQFKRVKFLPCIRQSLETGDVIREIQSPLSCYYNPSALVMGFSTLDPQLDTLHIATRTQCNKDPSCSLLIKCLIQITDISKSKIDHFEKNRGNDDQQLNTKILSLFDVVFAYLSSRTNDFEKRDLVLLDKKAFIPSEVRGKVIFFLPSQIFFKKDIASAETKSEDDHEMLTAALFRQIRYNAFLSLVGVKAEPSLQEIFELMLEKPDETLDRLGELQYKAVLQRIASDPPFKHVTKRISSSPFLLGYLVVDEEVNGGDEGKNNGQKAQYCLARAEEIYIVDNSFLRRQFPMLVSPMEQTLEEFYNKIGSRYVSEVVKKDFELQGRTHRDTVLTNSLANRLRERRPLLLSPTNSSRPLASNAAKMLDAENLEIIQVDVILGKYTFHQNSKHLKVTCCTKQPTTSSQKTSLYVTTNPDWFDIASAIGALILQRCQLEDSLLLSQLLESPLETLRYRGFPVDRILRPISKPPPEPSPQPVKAAKSIAKDQSLSPTPSQPVEAKKSIVKGKSPETNDSQKGSKGEEGFETIIKQMFPYCPADVIRGLLGANPTREKAREVANLLAAEMPPQKKEEAQELDKKSSETDSNTLSSQTSTEIGSLNDISAHNANSQPTQKKKSGLMGKVLRGLNHSVGSGGKRITHEQSNNFSHTADSNTPASPERDVSTHKSLETMLNQAVQSSRSVDSAGVRSPETLLNYLPQGLERGHDGCEVIPAQNIHAFKGPHGNYKSRNGIKVFSATSNGRCSPVFLSDNFNAVEDFAVIIQRIASVFKLDLATVAIYYDPNGSTIAFNASKALYFNLRYFISLHRNKADVAACYSYWYLTIAHELAHNLVSAHNKEHGSFTESIAAMYLPEFAKLLSQV